MATEKDIINFIADESFVEKVARNDFKTHTYNALIAIHMMAICFKTTGIKEFGFVFSYFSDSDNNVLKPRLGFHMYTTRDALVEDSSRCSNSSGSFNNHIFKCKNTRMLKEKFIKYFSNYAKTIESNYSQEGESIRLSETRANFRGSKKNKNADELFYMQIISSNSVIRSYIEKLFLEEKLSNNIKQPKKLKL